MERRGRRGSEWRRGGKEGRGGEGEVEERRGVERVRSGKGKRKSGEHDKWRKGEVKDGE